MIIYIHKVTIYSDALTAGRGVYFRFFTIILKNFSIFL